MPTFTNTSNYVFQDGDLFVGPGESFTTEDDGRIGQARGMYKWQFSEGKATKGVPTEAELTEDGPSKGLRELRETGHVKLDEDGNQAALVGDAATSKK